MIEIETTEQVDREEKGVDWIIWLMIGVICLLLILGKILKDHYELKPVLIHEQPTLIKSGWHVDLHTQDNWPYGIKPE